MAGSASTSACGNGRSGAEAQAGARAGMQAGAPSRILAWTAALAVAATCAMCGLGAEPAYAADYAAGVAAAQTPIVTQASTTHPPKSAITAANAIKSDSSGAAEVKWEKIDPSQIKGYEVQLSTSKKFISGTLSKTFSAKSDIGKKCSFRGDGLKFGTKYYVRVRTFVKSGSETIYSGWSDVVTLKTFDGEAGALPATEIIKAKPLKNTSSGAAMVKWKKVKSASVKGYEVALSTTKRFAKKTVLTNKFEVSSSVGKKGQFSGNGLAKGTTYYVKVRTYGKPNGINSVSKWSSVKQFTTYA